MLQTASRVDYAVVHPAPGYGKPLDWTPKEDDALYVGKPLPTALLQDSVTSSMYAGDDSVKKAFLPLLTVREFLMLRFMNVVTDKPEWQKKVADDDIVAKWRAETVIPNSTNEATMTDPMFDFCIAELRHKAKHVYDDPNTPIVVYNADVVKSDTAVPESVKLALQEAVKVLEDVPAREKDWHPGSNEMVLDLVHPSLFPLISGKSRIVKIGDKVVGRDECVTRCGEGEAIKFQAKEEDKKQGYRRRKEEVNPYSSTFQWLPCEVDISGGSSKIVSYINNLHPKHTELYGLIEKVIDAAIPLWERTLAPLQSEGGLQFFRRIPCDDVEYEKSEGGDASEEEGPSGSGSDDESENGDKAEGQVEEAEADADETNVEGADGVEGEESDKDADGEEEEHDDDDSDYQWSEKSEGSDSSAKGEGQPGDEEDEEDEDDEEEDEEEPWVPIQPNPVPFDAEKLTVHKPRSFKELYGERGRPLQVIVKLANIELTPEKAKYEGGSWHVEGKQNEHICATAIYYYASSNIKTSHLAFKQFVESETVNEFGYPQNDHGFLRQYFGCENEESGEQFVGEVETKEGRLLTFPNILQHQVQPFELEDPTKSGHRKILALFLVDPNVRVVSTAHVPAQQVDWWRESSETGKGTAAPTEVIATGLDKLPVELKDQVFDAIEGFPITLREAKELREQLMTERRKFVRDHARHVKENNAFSLCEH